MLNYVWSFLLIIGLITGALFGRLDTMVTALFNTCKDVVMSIALPLAGGMMLWLGVMRVMEKSGLMNMVAWVLSPILKLLFPAVPAGHPAMGAMTMNMAANMLGLGNSATPLGLKAMQHLQELNPDKRTASNAMCMFLALNTAGIALIPTTALTYLSAGGVPNPQAIIAPAFVASLFGTIVAVITALLLQNTRMFRVTVEATPVVATKVESASEPEAEVTPVSRWRKAFILLALVGFTVGALLQFSPELRAATLEKTGLQTLLDKAAANKQAAQDHQKTLTAAVATAAPVGSAEAATAPAGRTWRDYVSSASILAVPIVLVVAVLWGLFKGVRVYDEMVEGAKEGFDVAVRIMPYLVVMLAALTLFRESGALLLLEGLLRPVLNFIGMPVELLPMGVMRSLSGSGSGSILTEMIMQPDMPDMLKYTAAIMYGSSETTFYVLAVYFGSVGIRRIRHALAAGLIADVAGIAAAVTIGRLMFG